MAKTPTELSQGWWKKNKAKTLKSTGLGAALQAYETAWKDCEGPPTRCLAQFADANKALDKIEPAVTKAKSMCNKTLHKETLEALDAYGPLIKRAQKALDDALAVYQGYIDSWADIRIRTKAGMDKALKEMETLVKKAEATVEVCDKSVKAGKPDLVEKSLALANKVMGELKVKQVSVDATLSEARVPKAAKVSPHSDDLPPKASGLFEECRQMQNEIIAMRRDAESRLLTAIKACGG